jgi:hypothetical protein
LALLATLLIAPSAHSTSTNPAAVNPGEVKCILPIFEPAFLPSGAPGHLTEDQLQAEMTKLKQQIGENKGDVRVGFSGIFRGIDSLRMICRIAKANNLSVGTIIAVQTHSGGISFNKKVDLRQFQWRLDGKTYQGVPAYAKTGTIEFPPRDWQTPTPSRYCASVHESAINMVQSRAAEIRLVMDEYPGVIVVVNCAIEEEMATGGESADDQLATPHRKIWRPIGRV